MINPRKRAKYQITIPHVLEHSGEGLVTDGIFCSVGFNAMGPNFRKFLSEQTCLLWGLTLSQYHLQFVLHSLHFVEPSAVQNVQWRLFLMSSRTPAYLKVAEKIQAVALVNWPLHPRSLHP